MIRRLLSNQRLLIDRTFRKVVKVGLIFVVKGTQSLNKKECKGRVQKKKFKKIMENSI